MMTFTIWLILLDGISFISGESAAIHQLHEERRLADTDYKRGYISIDCGNDEPGLISGIIYSSDAAFVDTGINKQISSEFSFNGIYKTVRSFPDGFRNCYTLKPLNGRANNYLIRAQFMYGNYDGKNSLPVFDIYIGVNFWHRVDLSTAADKLFIEIVHKPTTESINICLVNIRQGTPFISALLLRPLNSSIYNSDLGSLKTDTRYKTGAKGSGDSTYVSYSDDIYDRFWGLLPDIFTSWELFNTSRDLTSITKDAYEIPLSIFMAGATPLSGEQSLVFHHNSRNLPEVFYVYWHFAETQKLSDNNTREFNIFVNGFQAGPIRPKYLHPLTIASSPIMLRSIDSGFTFFINQTNTSTLPPILNAVEIYSVIELLQSETNQDDVNAIMDVKTRNGPISGWQGDPCLPESPWDGLNCTDNGLNSPRITSLNLASRGLTGELLPSLSFLTSLKYLNVSNNDLTGTIPEFLAIMPSLQVIDLSGNNFSNSVPVKLTEKVKNGLLFLRFHYC